MNLLEISKLFQETIGKPFFIITEVTYCSFTLVEKFPDGCSKLDSPAYHDFKSITEREVRENIPGGGGGGGGG